MRQPRFQIRELMMVVALIAVALGVGPRVRDYLRLSSEPRAPFGYNSLKNVTMALHNYNVDGFISPTGDPLFFEPSYIKERPTYNPDPDRR